MSTIACNSILLFVSLLTAQIIKNSHILAETYFVFLSKRPGPNSKVFQYRISSELSEKIGKVVNKELKRSVIISNKQYKTS